MKLISMPAAVAVLFACSVTLGAQTSSTERPSSSTPRPNPSAQSGSTITAPTGSTASQNGTARPERRATRTARAAQTANPPQQVTLTGCLQANDQSAADTTNAASGASGARRAQASVVPTFILANASQASGPSSAEPRSVGTTGTGGPPTTAQSSANAAPASASLSGTGSGSYILQGLDLSRQTGQQVEVTGTMMAAPATRARSRATATSGSVTDAGASMPRIRVMSVRMLSEHCSNR